MAGRPRSRSDAEVLSAAMRVLGRHGPSRMTLAHVAAEVGLAPSTLAERFGSKRELLLAASRASASGVGEAFEAARAACASPSEAVVAALVELGRPARTRAAFANHLAALELDVSDPAFRRAAARHATELYGAISVLLTEAIAAGELTGDRDSIARALQVAYNGGLVVWAVSGSGPLEASLRADLEAVLEPFSSHRAARSPSRSAARRSSAP
jgi:AcrR family transcriptional regulator